MAIWMQSLSWALLLSLVQGVLVFAALKLVLLAVREAPAKVKYALQLAALCVLPVWFGFTWWQLFQAFSVVPSPTAFSGPVNQTIIEQQLAAEIANAAQQSASATMNISALFQWLAIGYIIGVALMLLRFSAGFVQVFSLRNRGISPAGAELNALLESIKQRLSISKPVRLLLSARAQVPMVLGFIRPIILVPVAALSQLSTAQLEAIVLHELAHIKRHDYIVNILQTVVETILFFNPFVWMISAGIRREMELCCDDLVLAHTREPLHYATALAALAHTCQSNTAFALAASGSSNHLFHRIKRIMEMKKHPFSYSRLVAAILVVTTFTGGIAWLSPSFAGTKNKKKEKVIERVIVTNGDMNDELAGEQLLIERLVADKLIDPMVGFVLVKNGDVLVVDGKQLTPEESAKYLQNIKPKYLRIQRFSGRNYRIPTSTELMFAPFTPQRDGC